MEPKGVLMGLARIFVTILGLSREDPVPDHFS